MILAIGMILGLIQSRRGVDRAASGKKRAVYARRAVPWRAMRIVGGCTAIGSLPLLLLWIFARDFPFWMRLSGFFTRTAIVIVYGGAHAFKKAKSALK